ncbi:YncE family protein [Streptomyces sp. NPDC060223]|uniref:YncE family protein n=1 Tax=unclassified Streptomyces TaxID=2593676 RepID=UPI003634130F
MRRRSISTATALAVLFSSVALSVVTTGTASAASVAIVSGPGGLVVDPILKRVFVGDEGDGRIQATDYNGNLVDLAVGLGDVHDLALSDDGKTLYAAVYGRNEIVALDTATLDIQAVYPIGTETGPQHLAYAGGRVWFTYGDSTSGNLGSVDPLADPAVAVQKDLFPAEAPTALPGWSLLDADPGTPGLLAVAGSGTFTRSTAVLDVTGTAPQLVAHSDAYNVGDVDLVPGTAEVLLNATNRLGYADGAFTAAGSYPTTGQLADVAADGLVAQRAGTDVAVYRANATKPLRTYTTPNGVNALAWAPDSSRIFVLAAQDSGYQLKVLTDPTKNVPTVTVSAPSTATRAKKLTVTGKLSATVPLPAGAKLAVTRTDLDSPGGKALAAVTVKSNGTYSFTDTPPAGGTVTYKVTYAGDAEHTSATASDKVTVSRAKPALSLNKNGKVYNYGTDVAFTAHLGSTYKNRTVEIWADPFGSDKPKKLLKTGKVNSKGDIGAWVDMTRDTQITAVFKGDARYAPRTVKVTAYARVKLSTAVTKHYKTAKIGSTAYYWFHKNTDPVLTTTMTYYPGRMQRLELEVYYQGSWYKSGSEYFALATNGKSAVSLEAPGESGIRARMRSAYINGSSGDTVNSTTYGSWKYLYFSN